MIKMSLLKTFISRVLLGLAGLLIGLNANAQIYDENTRQLTLPYVVAGAVVYVNVVIQLDNFDVLTAGHAVALPPVTPRPQTYVESRRELTMASVQVGRVWFPNVVVRLNRFTVLAISDPIPTTSPPMLATAPAITPVRGATDTSYSATVSFTASKSLSSARVKMICDGVEVTGTTTVSGSIATFMPAAPGYAPNAKCTATVNAAATKDIGGNAFISNVVITDFTVKALNCSAPVSNNRIFFSGVALVAVCGNVFVDPTVAKNQYPVIMNTVSTAIQMNKSFYGSLQLAQPDLIVCNTNACGTFFAGASLRNVVLPPNLPPNSYPGQYVASRMTVVLTSATWNRNPYVLAHEFSHVEVEARLNGKRIPAWFNEGLATYIGGEPECTNVSGKGIADLTTPDLDWNWRDYTSTSPAFERIYCQSRAEVAAWITKRGSTAVVQLLQAVSQGQSFTTQYGAMQTQ